MGNYSLAFETHDKQLFLIHMDEELSISNEVSALATEGELDAFLEEAMPLQLQVLMTMLEQNNDVLTIPLHDDFWASTHGTYTLITAAGNFGIVLLTEMMRHESRDSYWRTSVMLVSELTKWLSESEHLY